ncbi:hypothetical protein Mal52_19810 [Symmachiella dynata]|uniref:HEAT repeat protein n=2 Tax=Symmachiella dynata TaxID=2527995 RepID=A0A517ZM58_9PLAN|nr:hypothetical protein Mal52_19810 [Symmachiella dynata]
MGQTGGRAGSGWSGGAVVSEMKNQFPGFKRCMAMMRSRDPHEQEDGFHWLLPRAGDHVDELIDTFILEDDHGLRCWLLELLGEAKSAKCFDLFAAHLSSSDQSLRSWAVRGLEMLNTKPARTLLWKAKLPD